MNGNVFSDEGLCPTLTTNKGEGVKVTIGAMRGRTVKIAKVGRSEEGKKQRKESLAKGVDYTPFQAKEIKFEESDVMNCITTATTKDNLIQVSEYQQTLEINENGTSNCLTSVQKDNLVVEGIIQLNNPKHSNDRIYSDEGLSPTLNTMQGGNRQPFIQVIGSTGGKNDHNSRIYSTDGISPTILAGNNGGGQSPVKHLTHDYRIRKLSPLECFRLQGFSDEFHQKSVDSGVSASQRYKQAGNSISVPVIQAILKNLLK